jgi:hypothetical protein
MIEFGPLVLEKKIFKNISRVFLLLSYYLPLEKSYHLQLNKGAGPRRVKIGPIKWAKLN